MTSGITIAGGPSTVIICELVWPLKSELTNFRMKEPEGVMTSGFKDTVLVELSNRKAEVGGITMNYTI